MLFKKKKEAEPKQKQGEPQTELAAEALAFPIEAEVKAETPIIDRALHREFELFKVRKLLKKLSFLDLDPAFSQEDLKYAALKSRAYGFAGVAVLPSGLSFIRRNLEKNASLGVIAALSYPHGEETLKIKTYAAKQSFSLGANGVLVAVSLSPVRRGDFKAVKKECEKLNAQLSKRGEVHCLIDLSLLGDAETEKLFRLFRGSACTLTLTAGNALLAPADVSRVKELSGGCTVEALGSFRNQAECLALMEAGAERIFTPYADEAAESLMEQYDLSAADVKSDATEDCS